MADGSNSSVIEGSAVDVTAKHSGIQGWARRTFLGQKPEKVQTRPVEQPNSIPLNESVKRAAESGLKGVDQLKDFQRLDARIEGKTQEAQKTAANIKMIRNEINAEEQARNDRKGPDGLSVNEKLAQMKAQRAAGGK